MADQAPGIDELRLRAQQFDEQARAADLAAERAMERRDALRSAKMWAMRAIKRSVMAPDQPDSIAFEVRQMNTALAVVPDGRCSSKCDQAKPLFTPGLWVRHHYAGTTSITVAALDGTHIAEVADLIFTAGGRALVVNETAMANATVVAAAPALYAALEQILDEYVSLLDSGDCGTGKPGSFLEVKRARDALALARGEVP